MQGWRMRPCCWRLLLLVQTTDEVICDFCQWLSNLKLSSKMMRQRGCDGNVVNSRYQSGQQIDWAKAILIVFFQTKPETSCTRHVMRCPYAVVMVNN